MLEKIEDSTGIARRGNVLAAMTKLKQVCDHPALLLHDGSPIGRRSGKVVRLEEILAEVLAEGDRALCFTQFAEFGHLLVPHLSARLDTDIAFLHGGVPRRRREEIVQRFQDGSEDVGPPVLLASLKAGGTGLTLTAATHVVHLDRWWNPAVEQQATDRAFRIGQRRTVQVRTFSCPGTVEERIDALIRSKRALSELVVGDGEGWLTELSTATLRELFALGADALQDDEADATSAASPSGPPDEPAATGPTTTSPRRTNRSGAPLPRPARARSTAASRSTPPAAPSRAPGGRPGSSRCWRPPGSAGASPAGAPTPGEGQTVSLQVDAGAATARVQGSAARPYRVRIGVPTLDKAQWTAVLDALAADASLTAAMLAGELPREVEDVVAAQGVDLFPSGAPRPRHGLHLPGRDGPVQAPRRGVLPARRAVRRRPVRRARAAGPRPRDRARRAACPPHPRARGPAAADGPGRVLRRRAHRSCRPDRPRLPTRCSTGCPHSRWPSAAATSSSCSARSTALSTTGSAPPIRPPAPRARAAPCAAPTARTTA